MVRLTATLSVMCLLGALVLGILPDPRAQSLAHAQQDANRIAALSVEPDKVSWRLTEDAALRRAMVWGADGMRLYPPLHGMAPLPYEFSDADERDLVSFRAQTATVDWTFLDTTGRELVYCFAVPAVCLVYDRATLEETLRLAPGALSGQGISGRIVVLLVVASVALAGVALWHRTTATGSAAAFKIVPDHLIAIRDTLEVPLTPRDLKLLMVMQDRAGAVVTKDELYDAGWGRDYMPNSRSLDQHIINLRRKLDPDKSRPVLIETVHGVGYRLVI